MKGIREFNQSPPIVFIGHSLGCLVIKEAIVKSKEEMDETDTSILNSASGFLFFGVPHQGMAIESLVPLVQDNPNQSLLESLNRNSALVQRLEKEFSNAFGTKHPRIVSFYETERSPTAVEMESGRWELSGPLKVLVDVSSAVRSAGRIAKGGQWAVADCVWHVSVAGGAPSIITQTEVPTRWPHSADQVSVCNLRLTANAGRDVWGRPKEQPLELSVTVAVKQPFATAAKDDRVDASTVHYGHLSKNIIAAVSRGQKEHGWLSSANAAELVRSAILDTAAVGNLAASEITVHYPKASTLGEGAGVVWTLFYGPEDVSAVSKVLYLRHVRIPTLIGVNSNERLKKQTVVANLWIDKLSDAAVDSYVEVENLLIASIENTAFETLEALADTVSRRLFAEFINDNTPGSSVRLRLEKPSAVPFADAPAIQVYRTGDIVSKSTS